RREEHELGWPTARRERAVARLDLDDRPRLARAAPQQLLVAEDRAREEHAREARLARHARALERRHAAGEPAGSARRAGDLREDREVRVLATLGGVEVDEVELLRALGEVTSGEI